MSQTIRNAHGERLDFTLHDADGDTLVLIGHGVTGNKDRDWALLLAECLSAAGIAALRFSFAGNGDSEGTFEASCPSKEASDLEAVLDFAEGLDKPRLLYAGHSMVAVAGVLVAAGDGRLAGLISLAGMVHTEDFYERKFGAQAPGANLMWDKPECPLSCVFVDDMRKIGSVLPLASAIFVPWLLIHGTEDTVVPLVESEQAAALGRSAILAILADADHVFSGEHGPKMAALVTEWARLLPPP